MKPWTFQGVFHPSGKLLEEYLLSKNVHLGEKSIWIIFIEIWKHPWNNIVDWRENITYLLYLCTACTSETFASAMGIRMKKTQELDCIRALFTFLRTSNPWSFLVLQSPSFFPKCAPALTRPHFYSRRAREPTLKCKSSEDRDTPIYMWEHPHFREHPHFLCGNTPIFVWEHPQFYMWEHPHSMWEHKYGIDHNQ